MVREFYAVKNCKGKLYKEYLINGRWAALKAHIRHAHGSINNPFCQTLCFIKNNTEDTWQPLGPLLTLPAVYLKEILANNFVYHPNFINKPIASSNDKFESIDAIIINKNKNSARL